MRGKVRGRALKQSMSRVSLRQKTEKKDTGGADPSAGADCVIGADPLLDGVSSAWVRG